MDHVPYLAVTPTNFTLYGDGSVMLHGWPARILCKRRIGFCTKRTHLAPSLSWCRIRSRENRGFDWPGSVHAHANGAAELWETGTVAENLEDTSLLLDASNVEESSPGSVEVGDKGVNAGKKSLALKGIYPGGLRRAEVRIPGLVMIVAMMDVLGPGGKEFLEFIDFVVAAGFTMVVLESGQGSSGDQSVGGVRLYEAARMLKATLRGRGELLVADRVDIAAAAGASGIVLSDEGLPAVVARSMMQNVNPENVVLPLVARSVRSAETALVATASEGADLLILQGLSEIEAKLVIESVKGRVTIPIFAEESIGGLLKPEGFDSPSLEAGASGLVYRSIDMKAIPTKEIGSSVSSLVVAAGNILQCRTEGGTQPCLSSKVSDAVGTTMAVKIDSSKLSSLDLQFKTLLEEERRLLTPMIELLKEASPQMEEVSLLIDAVAQLDEPFLLMVVGEFNSGKSSVINALLGKRYLPEGVLPTTNEIALLKHAGDGVNAKERSERHPDGHFMYYLPAEILKEINLVDTPGTNVILKRQQRLTEEFVPRADLVLFVLSADRPFTESEMAFLRYILQWDKKIIFLLNKSDIFSDQEELDQVVRFVKSNAQQVLSVEQATIYAVSARKAFQAKHETGVENGSLNAEELQQNSSWESSGFQDLEKFIADFLGGSSDAGAERRRLKLASPLGIVLALLEACKTQLFVEEEKAKADLQVLNQLINQVESHQKAMESNSSLQRQRLSALIDAAKGRGESFVDSTLRLSNIDAVVSYLLGGDRRGTLPVAVSFDTQVMGSVQDDLQRLLVEHHSLLKDILSRQVNKYTDFVTSKWPSIRTKVRGPLSRNGHDWSESKLEKMSSIVVLDGFDIQAAKIVLEQELRDVIVTTVGGLGAAGASASVLTSILPNMVEDLLALAVCSAGGLVGVWNLPSRRAEVKRKVSKVADSFASQLEVAMVAEVRDAVEQLRMEIDEVLEPYLEAAKAEANRVSRLQERVLQANSQIETLRLRVQNLGIA